MTVTRARLYAEAAVSLAVLAAGAGLALHGAALLLRGIADALMEVMR